MEIDEPPGDVLDCRCSICRRYGTLWAYYAPAQVRITPAEGATDIYMWQNRDLEFHRCRTCGCVTHWSAAPKFQPFDRMGVNARLMEPEVLAGAELRVSGHPG
jgi:hypothetical protein